MATWLPSYDGVPCEEISTQCGCATVHAITECTSTMDLAHGLAAAGAPHGTVVVAASQSAGRGRSGKSWISAPGDGVWVSTVLRPDSAAPGALVSLRTGLALALALEGLVGRELQLKWPNDLFLDGRKLAGILIEARWHGSSLDWIVVGVGVNVRPQAIEPPVAYVGESVRCAQVLRAVVRATLDAAGRSGPLTDTERGEYHRRDLAVGRDIVEPVEGMVLGVTADGALEVRSGAGIASAVSGSLVFRSLA